ncbi:MAG: transposase [Woeseiaceae bacterium]|nr:transposase [Woeseiaceae bacterium]
MPRQCRYFVPNIAQHVITRGIDRQAVFFHPQDYALYREALQDAATTNDCQVHAYVLMTNHVHLLVTPSQERSLPLMMQAMGRQYVQRVNARYGRTGTLWEGRYKASPVQDNYYLLACQRYIELNPVRARVVDAPGAYPYSSYAYHAAGVDDALITAHPCYLSLAQDHSSRQSAYRVLFQDVIDEKFLTRIRKTTNACGVIGDDRFKDQIEAMLGRRVPTGTRGRPTKSKRGRTEFSKNH